MKIFVTGGSGFIGLHLIRKLLDEGNSITNYDLEPPSESSATCEWIQGNLLDKRRLSAVVKQTLPDVVIHLAARTDCDENTTIEKGYEANTSGTENVLNAIKESDSVKRCIFVSSQFVCGPGRLPKNDEDYFPHTVYGQSKVLGEMSVRQAGLDCTWTIVRPTNIWGPHHPRYAKEFLRIVEAGLYFQPNFKTPTRTYGYVGNVVDQMAKILEAERSIVDRRTFYLGDPPIDISYWTDGFHFAMKGRKARRVPTWIVKSLALLGDGISRITGKPFYITSSRLDSMSRNYLTPIQNTFDTFGEPKFTLEEGIDATVAWFRSQ